MKEIKLFIEDDVHCFLQSRGFQTNYRKHKNENGVDIIALKNGYSFLIEHKIAELRENGTYRISGDIIGDILIISTPTGQWSVDVTRNLTKSCRFLDILDMDK